MKFSLFYERTFGKRYKHAEKVRGYIPNPRPNDSSVVLSVSIEDEQILFGGDLEVIYGDSSRGWAPILRDEAPYLPKHGVYKVPHHGSPNGDHQDIWSQMLISNPRSVITPFVRGRVNLPGYSDLKRIQKTTSMGFLTSAPFPKREKFVNGSIKRLVKRSGTKISRQGARSGQVRMRKFLGDVDAEWRVDLFGDSRSIPDVLRLFRIYRSAGTV